MVRKILMSALVALVAGSTFAAAPVRSEVGELMDRSIHLQLAQAQRGRYGPYPTQRRAIEVANHFRSLGFNAQVIPQWGDYYVNVW
jgi:hypothetical protein